MSEHHPRLLALDGGGVRGLSSLQILKQLMWNINPEAPPKPCEYFDLIGGTSTGGLIAIMLGCLNMTVDECINAYLDLSGDVFQKQRHRISIRGQIQGRFDWEQLEHAIKKIVVERGLDQDALLQTPPDAKCRVFVCATSKEVNEVVRLRSYHTPRAPTRAIKIWEAGRATSAATSFFDPISVGPYGETFVDGALGANNPVNELWKEAQDLWSPSGSLEDTVQCVVSLGTGVQPFAPFKDSLFNISKSLAKMATETEITAESFVSDKRRLYDRGRYYRFNVPRGLSKVGLADLSQKGAIAAATDRYIQTQAVFCQIQACANMLKQVSGFGRLESHSAPAFQGADRECLEICQRELRSPAANNRFGQIQKFDTSAWLFEHETYLKWSGPQTRSNPAAALLMIKGKPGVGKSVLMKEVVLANEAVLADEGPITITTHHFFSAPVEGENASPGSSISVFLRSLLGQLINKVPRKPWKDIRDWGKELQAKGDAGLWSNDRLQELIKQIVSDNKTTADSKAIRFRIFIDAINECSDKPTEAPAYRPDAPLAILDFATTLLTAGLSAGVDIGVCISRQHLPQYGTREPEARVIELEKHLNGAVLKYIRGRLQELPSDELRFRLFLRLRQGSADGFLWASLITQQILEMSETSTFEELEEFANKVPHTLDGMYQKTLATTKVSRDSQILHLFQMALGALRPMTADQFRHALAFVTEFKHESIEAWEGSSQGLQPGERFEKRLKQESRGLMEIVSFEGSLSSNEAGREIVEQVRFTQSSFKTFLRGEAGLGCLHPDFSTKLEERCHLFLFKICLRVLDFCRLRGQDNVKILGYACEFWLCHAQKSDDVLETIEEVPNFMRNCKTRKASRVIEESIRQLKLAQAKEHVLLEGQSSMLVLLATMGCTCLLRQHLQTCLACNEACTSCDTDTLQYRTALNNAIIGGWLDTASYLLELRSQGDINSLVDDTTLLYDACYFGSKGSAAERSQGLEVVRFLLSRGADPAIPSLLGYEFPLHAAIVMGNKALIEELLGPQATKAEELLKARACGGWTALHVAIESGRPHHERLSVLETVLKFAPKEVFLLELRNDDGNTPRALAEMVDGPDGEDLLEAFEDFQLA